MTPNELYARDPESVVRDDLYALKGCYYDHLPEVEAQGFELAPVVEGPMRGRFELRFYRRHNFDHRRVWSLYALFFDGAPVMVLQNAGREGDDHHRRIVTDPDKLALAVTLIRSHLGVQVSGDVADPASEVDGLTTFYNHDLQGHFETHW